MKYVKTWGIALFIAIIVIITMQFFIVKIYVFRGNSMANTIADGDYILINKISKIKRFDIVAFNNPADFKLLIKRLVGLPGDTLIIKKSNLYINGKKLSIKNQINLYRIECYSKKADSVLRTFDFIDKSKINLHIFEQNLSEKQRKKLSATQLITCNSIFYENNIYQKEIFPHSNSIKWNKDNFGEVIIPKKNQKVNLTSENIYIYKKIIEKFEKNKLELKNDKIYINNKDVKTYKFKNNYCFVLNDNRTDISDSRSFGFLPFDNIIGKKIK